MSYNIQVSVSDGEASVTTSGEVPDGTYTVAGHEDERQRSLSVTRQGTDGRYIETASHIHHKES